MELRPESGARPRLSLVQALRYALVPTLVWGGLFLLVLSALPGWAWRAKVQVRQEEGLLMIGLIGMWRYGWYLLQLVRGFFYSRFVYPSLRYSAFIQRAPFPERCYFLLPSYFEDPGVTVRTFRALAREVGLLPQVQVTVVATLGSDDEETLVRRILAETPGGERVRLVCTRQSEGKRKAMADGLRVIGQLRARDVQYIADRERSYHDAVVFMDGDTEMGQGTLAQCLPFLKAYPKMGAVTTDEIGRIYGASGTVRAWFALKFIKRHSVMKSLSLSRKVLTLTGRYSVFRADAVLTEEMAQYLEHDGIRDWRYGRIKFLMGDDKSTWYCLVKNGWDMLYLPDVVVYSLETRTDPFFKLSRSLMLRWNGNTLRTNSRALKLGPRQVGWFTWWAILDQRISMWTTLIAPIAMILLTLFVTPWFAAFYAAWIIGVRLFQLLMLVLQGHRMRVIDLPLQVYDQWAGAFFKVVASFTLGKQSWGKAKGKTSQSGYLPLRRRWVPYLQASLALVALVLFVGLLTGVLQTPNLLRAPRTLERAFGGVASGVQDAAVVTGDAAQDAVQHTGEAVQSGLDATDNALENAADATGNAVRGAADATGDAVPRVGEGVENAAQDAGQVLASPPPDSPLAPDDSAPPPANDDGPTAQAEAPSLNAPTSGLAGVGFGVWGGPLLADDDTGRTLDLTAYGARPNDRQDDSEALRRALRDATPGTTIRLPAGRLDLDRPVTIVTDDVTLRGAGRTRTTLVYRFTRAEAGEAPPGGMPTALAVIGRKGRRIARLSASARGGATRLTVAYERGQSTPRVGTLLWLGAPNDAAFLLAIGSERWNERYPYVRQLMTPLAGASGSRLTLRDALDLDLPVGTEVFATEPVRGVQMEGFTVTHEVPGASASAVAGVYENRYPDYMVSALAYLWADGGRLQDVGVTMAGGHAVVFENSYGVHGERLVVNGAWNKGSSGTGYVRFARAFGCTLRDPLVQGIRHVAFQWSSSQNRIVGGRLEVDVNFHGGYSRYNVVSGTVVAPPASHRWGAVTTTARTAHWAPPDGPGNRVEGHATRATARGVEAESSAGEQ